MDHLTVKAIIGGCTAETPLIKAYAGKVVISPQENALSEAKIDQNSLITNRKWRKQQDQDKTIGEIIHILEGKKLSEQKVHNTVSEEMKTMLRHRH